MNVKWCKVIWKVWGVKLVRMWTLIISRFVFSKISDVIIWIALYEYMVNVKYGYVKCNSCEMWFMWKC